MLDTTGIARRLSGLGVRSGGTNAAGASRADMVRWSDTLARLARSHQRRRSAPDRSRPWLYRSPAALDGGDRSGG